MSNESAPTPLPSIETSPDSAAVFAALSKMSKQGKLAGYQHQSGESSATADAHGNPFDSDLVVSINEQSVVFDLKMRSKLPIVFAVVLILTVWPGLPLTDSFMFNFAWYERLMGDKIQTWMWYLPMTALPIPFVWRSSMMKSQKTARAHALETIEKIRAVLG